MRYLYRNTQHKPCVTCGNVSEWITVSEKDTSGQCITHRPLVHDQTIPPFSDDNFERVEYHDGMLPPGTEILFGHMSYVHDVVTTGG